MKTIVMTGGTSGLGEIAANRMARTPDIRLLLGARGRAGAETDVLPLDLTRLASVRDFAHAVGERLGQAPIDVLVLNAGTQYPTLNQRTEDGFETTFAVNHLAHYLLLRSLLIRLADGARVVITTSDTHDPKIMPLGPRELDPEALAHPPAGRASRRLSAGFRAYASSKLCNLLTARALAAMEEARTRHWTVIAYNPGFTPGTALSRSWPWWARALTTIGGWVRPVARFSTVDQAGETLADLALGRIEPPQGRIYASLVSRRLTWPDPSELARRDDVMNQLWRDSAHMVGGHAGEF